MVSPFDAQGYRPDLLPESNAEDKSIIDIFRPLCENKRELTTPQEIRTCSRPDAEPDEHWKVQFIHPQRMTA